MMRLHLQQVGKGSDQGLVRECVPSMGPLELQFNVPMLQCSRVELKHVRVYDGGKSNEDAYRWLRYYANGTVKYYY